VRSFEVRAIGRVSSPLTDLEAAPRQPDEGAPAAWLVFDEDVIEGLLGIRPGDEVLVITWLDRAGGMCCGCIPVATPAERQRASSALALRIARIRSACTGSRSPPSMIAGWA